MGTECTHREAAEGPRGLMRHVPSRRRFGGRRGAALRAAVVVFGVVLAGLAMPAEPAAAETGPVRIYFVKPGDSLSEIADASGIEVDALASLNRIVDSNRLRHGTALVIPTGGSSSSGSAPAASGTTYRVTAGDTLSEIAAMHDTDTGTLATLNGVTNRNAIYVGMVLTLPAAPVAAAALQGSEARAQHVVQRGETLGEIAARYGVSRGSLASANGVRNENLIRIGTTLLIPATRQLPAPPSPIASAISDAAWEKDVDPYLVLGLSYLESGWQMSAVSRTNAVGVMQLMPETGAWASDELLGRQLNWRTSLVDNVRVGTSFLAYLLDRTGGDVEDALAGYYQGLGSVGRYGLFSDTRQYIDDVLALVEMFRSRGALG